MTLIRVLSTFLSLTGGQVWAQAQPTAHELATPLEARLMTEIRGLFDEHEWVVRKAIPINLGGDLTNATAALLRSASPKGASGVGEPLFAVDMLLVKGHKVLYHDAERHLKPEFFIDDTLEARDVTGDGVPEVVFHSGFVGASDWETFEHVIYRSPGESFVLDVAPHQFVHSRRHTFRWLEYRRVTLGLVADPLDPASSTDPHMCHGCPKYYHYLVFRWDSGKKAFILLRSIQSTRDFEDNTDPLREDLPFIRDRLSKECP